MSFIPATQELYLLANQQRQAFLSYLISLTPDKSISIPIEDINILLDSLYENKIYLRTDVGNDSIVVSLGEPDFTPAYEGLLWVDAAKFNLEDLLPEDLVPHG